MGERTLLYLHGLASSPRGRKRDLLERRLGPEGFGAAAPDLNAPSFRDLSFEAIVSAAAREAAVRPPALVIGSSLGALVALALSRRPEGAGISLVLLAPALAFAERWRTKLPEGDPLEMYHHGDERNLWIRRGFFEEMADVQVDEVPPPVPVSAVMGTDDESVPCAQGEERWRAWEASGSLCEGSALHVVPGGDHSLLAYGEIIEAAIRERLGFL